MSKKRKRYEEKMTDEILDLNMDDVIDLVAEKASLEQELMEEMLDYEQSVMNLENKASEQYLMINEKGVKEDLENLALKQDQMKDQESNGTQPVMDHSRDMIAFELFMEDSDELETVREHDRMQDEEMDYAQEVMNEATFEQDMAYDNGSDYTQSLANELEAAFEHMTEDEVFDYEQSVINRDTISETWLMQQDSTNQDRLTVAEELIREEELAKDEILGTESGWLRNVEDENQLMEILRYQEMVDSYEPAVDDFDPDYYDWTTREEQWSLMNTEWFNEDHDIKLHDSEEFANSEMLREKAAMEESLEKMRKDWIATHGKAIMNEEWRSIIEEMMDTGISEMAADQRSWNWEAMAHHQHTRNEEAMDYEQSIMNEMMGWYNTAPTQSEQLQSKFDYTRLDQPEHEIRVVRLHPRRWPTDPTITCDITIVDLSAAPEYEALSYEWGSPSRIEYTIQLNQKPVAVRQNLWWALYDLRDSREPRTFWIDTLCINQTNIHERNCQVSRMGSIYSQAARVVAWIGQDDFESRYGLKFLSELASISPKTLCRPYGRCRYRKHRWKWRALSTLFNRSYWSRLWIIQEVVLASHLRIQCGTFSFEWENLAQVFNHLSKSKTGSCSPGSRLAIVSSVPFRLEMQRRDQQMAVLDKTNANFIPLLDLVDLFKDASCFDARDKIFGLRSLSSECCRNAVVTDYSMAYEDVLDILSAHHEAEHLY